ncbi:MAG: ATP-binding protein, partial [Defluviitaleaceae bacterium]|nr:ATP-binding protein [Defluviitaleaceae bacterium]
MSRVAQHKKVDLTFTCNKNNFSAIGDYGRLRQMLIIVVDNAIKFSPEKSSVVIDLEKIVNCIQIHIRDQGCGIPIYDIDYIFDRFYKQRSEHNKTGSGLGLAIAKQIADRHSITIKVVNIPDGGAEFTFEIPLIVD